MEEQALKNAVRGIEQDGTNLKIDLKPELKHM